ncbi:hypothetical protein FSP39_009240 [Pinctada imbricata]|uniref:Uncharacterized protein n=1 Tax=Pinctada imbricata TaxID=66713 RepID=A0AA88YI68_PINIB|nr:hypothetical protein FSP39_009240 [Pinctada imbricata]
MTSQQQGMENIPAYTVIDWADFEAHPRLMYNLFEPTIRPGGRTYTSEVVMDMSASKFNTDLSEIKVTTVEDLHRVTNDLLTMPILFRTKVEHTRTDHYVVMKVRRKWKNEFAVLVNTRHPSIREPLSHELSRAMAYMQEGKNFCLKLSFGPSVRNWYSGVVDAQSDGCDSRSNSDSGHMMIYVTNKSTPNECCVNPCCILCCFPFWLLCGGPCYCIHRHTTVEDFSHRFIDIPIQLLTAVPYRVTVTQINNPPPQGQGQVMPPPGGPFPTHTGYPMVQQSNIPPTQAAPPDPRTQAGYGYDQYQSGPPPAYPGPPGNAI